MAIIIKAQPAGYRLPFSLPMLHCSSSSPRVSWASCRHPLRGECKQICMPSVTILLPAGRILLGSWHSGGNMLERSVLEVVNLFGCMCMQVGGWLKGWAFFYFPPRPLPHPTAGLCRSHCGYFASLRSRWKWKWQWKAWNFLRALPHGVKYAPKRKKDYTRVAFQHSEKGVIKFRTLAELFLKKYIAKSLLMDWYLW